MYVYIPGKPLKIDALRVAIKDHDLKVEAANAEAAAALLAAQDSPMSFNSTLKRGSLLFNALNFRRGNSDMTSGNSSTRRRSFLGRLVGRESHGDR